jgi:hypothetical protein
MKSNEKQYCVVIADIINSRYILNRLEIQDKYIQLSETLNKKYRSDIASKFIVTMGDEMQGLLEEPNNIISIIKDMQTTMYPIKLRFGIGIGTINTKIDFENSVRIDGNAYHRARFCIDQIKELNKKNPDTYSIMINSNNEVWDDLVNSNLMLCTALRASWTDKQDKIVNMYELCNKDQGETAKALSVSQSYISKTLKVVLYKNFTDALNTVSNAIIKGISYE